MKEAEIKKIEGKFYYCFSTDFEIEKKFLIYKVNSEKPYFRYYGRYFTLKDELLAELRKLAGEPKLKKQKPEDEVRKGFRAEMEKVYAAGSDMLEYCMSRAGAIVKLDNGSYFELEKPRIKTHFCFGYHTFDEEGYKSANEMAAYAGKSHDYFKSENLKDYDDMIEAFESDNPFYCFQCYDGAVKICSVRQLMNWEREEKNIVPKITENDRQKIIAALKTERIKFEKRLDTYLKKYGTSNVKSWSYWADE